MNPALIRISQCTREVKKRVQEDLPAGTSSEATDRAARNACDASEFDSSEFYTYEKHGLNAFEWHVEDAVSLFWKELPQTEREIQAQRESQFTFKDILNGLFFISGALAIYSGQCL